jgi:hypothetical protein
VRVLSGPLSRLRDPDGFEQGHRALTRRSSAREPVNRQRFLNLIADV